MLSLISRPYPLTTVKWGSIISEQPAEALVIIDTLKSNHKSRRYCESTSSFLIADQLLPKYTQMPSLRLVSLFRRPKPFSCIKSYFGLHLWCYLNEMEFSIFPGNRFIVILFPQDVWISPYFYKRQPQDCCNFIFKLANRVTVLYHLLFKRRFWIVYHLHFTFLKIVYCSVLETPISI